MRIEDHSIVAWVGEDEMGSGRIGIKQGLVPSRVHPARGDGLRRLQTPATGVAADT